MKPNIFVAERKRVGLTQIQMAELLNVSPTTLARYEHGGKITPEMLCAIADIYECSVDYLLGRSDVRKIAEN